MYISELRKRIASRPIIVAGATAVVMNEKGEPVSAPFPLLRLGSPRRLHEPSKTLEEAARRELEKRPDWTPVRFNSWACSPAPGIIIGTPTGMKSTMSSRCTGLDRSAERSRSPTMKASTSDFSERTACPG